MESTIAVTDQDFVDIVGSAQPGAIVSVISTDGIELSSVQADATGAFKVHLASLVEGDTPVQVRASLTGYQTTNQRVTITRSISEAAYKKSAASIPYNQLIKDPDSMAGRVVTYRGEVFQYDSATTTSHLIIAVTDKGYGFWTDHVFLDVDPTTTQNVYKDTIIQFWGNVVGAYTYETVNHGNITIPEVRVRYVQVVN